MHLVLYDNKSRIETLSFSLLFSSRFCYCILRTSILIYIFFLSVLVAVQWHANKLQSIPVEAILSPQGATESEAFVLYRIPMSQYMIRSR